MTTRITSDEVRHLALLCRVAMSDDDVELMREQMSNILDNIDALNQGGHRRRGADRPLG